MIKKIFYQLSLLIFSILSIVLSITYALDALDLMKEAEVTDILTGSHIISIVICIMCILVATTSLIGFISSCFYDNDSAYIIFKTVLIVNIAFTAILIAMYFMYSMDNRINTETINEISRLMESSSTRAEEELNKFWFSILLDRYIPPAILCLLFSEGLNILSYSIYSKDQEVIEVEIEDPSQNTRTSRLTAEEKKLEESIKILESKLKQRDLQKRYDALLKKLEDDD